MLTDLLDDLAGASDEGEQNAVLVRLHNEAADLYLRGQGQWSGTGKALIRKMTGFDPDFTKRFVEVFMGNSQVEVAGLVDLILEAHGGRLRDGYRSAAPDAWKRFKG